MGGGVRRGFSVGVGVGVGEDVSVGSAMGCDVGSGVALGTGVGSCDATGVAEGVGGTLGPSLADGVGSNVGPGVTTTPAGVGFPPPEVGVGAAVIPGGGASVGVISGATVPLGANTLAVWAMKPEAANTNTPPSRATATIVTTSVPVVRIAPRKTRAGRSASHEWCS